MFFPFERSRRGAARVERAAARRCPTSSCRGPASSTSRRCRTCPRPSAGARSRSSWRAFLGAEAEGRELLRPLRALGPELDTFAMVPPVALADLAMDPRDPLPFRSAHALLDELPSDGDRRHLAAIAGPGSALAMVQFRHMGGALGRRAPGAGARATLPGEICVFGLGVVPGAGRRAGGPLPSSTPMTAAVAPHRAGDYPNFVEEPADASAFFDHATWARLHRGQGALRPRGPVQGQPPHPAGLGAGGGRLARWRGDARPVLAPELQQVLVLGRVEGPQRAPDDDPLGRLGVGGHDDAVLGQPAGQVLAGDLAVRPPQRRALVPRPRRRRVRWPTISRPCTTGSPGSGTSMRRRAGDAGGRHARLVGRQAAELDRRGDAVAGRPRVPRPRTRPSSRVTMKPSSSHARPGDRGPEDPRHGEDALDVEPLAAGREREAIARAARHRARDDADAGPAQLLGQRRGSPRSPNSASGSRSGVTTVTSTSAWPIARASPAVISASS